MPSPLAAFTRADPSDRAAFDSHYQRIRSGPSMTLLAIDASIALLAFLDVEPTRPLFARVAEHNAGSAKVLTRAGFVQCGSDKGFANGVGREVVEHTYRLAG